MKERNQGKYYGIGVSFEMRDGHHRHLPHRRQPVRRARHPRRRRIVKIDGSTAKGINNEEVFDKLRGAKGTTVHVTIRRPGQDEADRVRHRPRQDPDLQRSLLIHAEARDRLHPHHPILRAPPARSWTAALQNLESQGMERLDPRPARQQPAAT